MKKNLLIIGIIVLLIAIIAGAFIIIKNINTTGLTNVIDTNTITSNTTLTNSTTNEATTSNTINEEETNMYSTGKHNAEIVVKNYGTISVQLDADVAPITVANFAKLVNEGFYNGLTFHRIISGFMIQGGDPLGTGMGGSDENIKGEFQVNGVKNTISHVRGTISMARSSQFNSASSQFFIMHEDGTYLDGQYAAFGTVTSGMEIVDKICEDTKVTDSNGTVSKENQPVIEKITMID